MYTLEDVYKTFPSGCTEDYKILRAFKMGKQTSDKKIENLSKHILDLQKDKGNLTDKVRELEAQIEQLTYLHNEDVSTIKLLNKQIKEIKEND